MTNKDFKEGMKVSFNHYGNFFKDGILHKDGIKGFAYPTYEFEEWTMRIAVDDVTNLQPKFRTIDDLECGDYVVDNCGNKRRCLGKCGEICFLSRIGNDETSDGIGPLSRIKSLKYTLYQEPIPTDDTIEIEGVKYKASEVKEALKNFKK